MSAATPIPAPSAELLELQQLKANVAAALPELVAIRRHLHAHPELSGNEHQTAALVAGELRGLGWSVREGVGRTGVLAELGPAQGPLVALRVDMDALPVEERTGLPYASRQQGVMHACGHDIHTSVGLGVARLLAPLADRLPGRVRLLFQPAEETAQGAAWMRADGAMEGVEALFGVHVFPSLDVGRVGVRSGSLTAAAGRDWRSSAIVAGSRSNSRASVAIGGGMVALKKSVCLFSGSLAIIRRTS